MKIKLCNGYSTPIITVLYHSMIPQYNLVGGIFGITLVITKLSNIMLLWKIQDYLNENSSSTITVLVNLRNIHKFDLFWSSRTLWLNFQGKVGYYILLDSWRCPDSNSIIKNCIIDANENYLYGNSRPIITVSKILKDFPIQFTSWDTRHCPDNDKIMKSNALDENKKPC